MLLHGDSTECVGETSSSGSLRAMESKVLHIRIPAVDVLQALLVEDIPRTGTTIFDMSFSVTLTMMT
jgi:hypothetical protein